MSFQPSLALEPGIERALALDAETSFVEFKTTFNHGERGELLEVIKDILAMANSGGGTIIFGLNSNGTPSGADLKAVATLDPATISDSIYKYTDCQFGDIELRRLYKDNHELWSISVGPAHNPIVFSQTGNYADVTGKQKNAFSGGSIYFRHGAKSETGNSEDLRLFIERRLESIRREWMDGIAKVVEAPSGSVVQVLSPGDAASGTGVRFTTNPMAPGLPVGSIDLGWPHRLKEVVTAINKALAGVKVIHSAHLLNIRKAYDIEANGDFCYTQMHVSPKYSPAFVSWILDQFGTDKDFFERAKGIADQKKSRAADA